MDKKIILTKTELKEIIFTCVQQGISTGMNYPKDEDGRIGQSGRRHAENEAIKELDTEIQLFLEE